MPTLELSLTNHYTPGELKHAYKDAGNFNLSLVKGREEEWKGKILLARRANQFLLLMGTKP